MSSRVSVRWWMWVVLPLAVACGGDGQSGGLPTAGGSAGQGQGGEAGSGGSGGSGGSAGSEAQAGESAGGGCNCDDGVACTRDACVDGECEHTALHFECPAGQLCDDEAGCSDGSACANDDDCERPDNCLTVSCDAASRRCMYAALDGDLDGAPPESCGGNDCDDDDDAIYGGSAEVCDGKDNDCDGVADPPLGSGCADGRSCVSAGCRCAADELDCLGVCVQSEQDDANCGGCGIQCSSTEKCMAGDCVCGATNEICDTVCVDLQADQQHCGDCFHFCNNAECIEGDCVCPNGGVDCSVNDVPACVDAQSDEQHCGACGSQCMVGGLCTTGDCDSTVEWVSVVRGYAPSVSTVHYAQMDVDAAGNSYVVFNDQVTNYELFPDGQETLWNTRSAVVKFEADGDFAWAQPASVQVTSLAVADGKVFVAGSLNTFAVAGHVAGEDFALASNHQAATAVVQLDAETGDVIDSFQLDHLEAYFGYLGPTLRHDATNVWLAMPQKYAALGAATWTQPSAAHLTFIYPIGGEPLWLPGSLASFTVDANQKPVVGVSLAASTTVNFGGQDLTTDQNGGSAIVRYNANLTHDVSYLSPVGGSLPGAAIPTTFYPFDGIFWRQAPGGQLEVVGQELPFFSPSGGARVAGDRYFLFGNTAAAEYEGRTFLSGMPTLLVLSGSGTVLALERALSIFTATGGLGYGAIEDFALVEGGTKAILAVHLDGGFSVAGTAYDIGTGYQGLALVKVKLYDP